MDASSQSASLNVSDIFPDIESNFIKINEKFMRKLDEKKNKYIKAITKARERKKEEEKKNIVEIEAKRKRIAEKRLKDSLNANPEIEKSLITLPLDCSKCNCNLTSLKNIQRHFIKNPNCRSSQFKCIWCPRSFIWPAAYIKHFRKIHLGPGGKLKRPKIRTWHLCDICRKPLLSKHSLNLHRSKFHGQIAVSIKPSPESENSAKRGRKQGTRVCRLCKKTFHSSVDYFNHIKNLHNSNDGSNSLSESVSRNLLPMEEDKSPSQSSIERKQGEVSQKGLATEKNFSR